ncbi:MAG: adenosylcobalamin-dependent ribonucleoside-diphosphate reductase [Phycisphaerales bacterium]|nr:adenosylcobalamin-dependent ribonucleoside-diphosphate reductase [Phycisphaerales bacterium]
MSHPTTNGRPVATQDQPKLTENARKVLEARYLKKNEAGECIETPADLFHRVAQTVANVEKMYGGTSADVNRWEKRFYDLMTTGDFMPNSPTLMNAGREMGMLSACFVLPVRDSIDEIFNSIKHTALIQKAGGGTGFAFDELRPTGDFISSSGGTTSGPISFWRAFSEATNAIQQGAFRRGANMGMMYIHHPDILKFLHAKQDLTQFTNYNISVKVTDAWMDEFNADPDSPHVVRNPRTGACFLIPKDVEIWKYDVRSLIEINAVKPIESKDPKAAYFTAPELVGALPEVLAGKVYTKRDIWNIIIQNAWQTGEPGVVFIDRINEANPTPHVGRMEATNPCGEQPLLPYEACNLGSVNLGSFIRNECTPDAFVDWDALRECVHASTRFLDNVIDANNYPLPEIDAICKSNRKIGLGIMGFADALYKLNIAYNSDAGVAMGEQFMKFVNDEAHNCSETLARDRGCFPNWKGSHWETKYQRLMRNSCTTTVAPTGTISIISNCSGGIEPMFSLAFIRNVLRGQKQGEKPLVEVNETFLKVAKARGFYSEDLLERIATEGTLAHIDEIPQDVKDVFVCAHDIAPEWHMQMQAGFQRHNDSSISKTINFPHDSSAEDVEKIYRLAYELRCKGVTVYRDGCRNFQPMALKDSEKKHAAATESANSTTSATASAPAAAKPAKSEPCHAAAPAAAPVGAASAQPVSAPAPRQPARLDPADLPEIVSGLRIRQMTPFGNMHVKITVDPRSDRELEVFAQLGKGGDVATSDLEAICRMISLWLRAGGSLKHVIKQLEGIGSSLQIPTKFGRIMSLGDGLACALKKYMRAKERFGLKPLLLGEVDLSQLDSPGREVLDRAVPGGAGILPAASPTGGNGNGNGGHTGPQNGGGKSEPIHASGGPAPAKAAVFESRISDASIVVTRTETRTSGEKRSLQASATAEAGTDSGDSGIHEAITETAVAVIDESVEVLHSDSLDGHVHADSVNGHAVAHAADVFHADGSHSHGIEMLSAQQAELLGEAGDAIADIADIVEIEDAIFAEAAHTEISAHPATIAPRTVRHFHDSAEHFKVKCPECNSALALQEGCRKCHSCGWSAC